MIYMYSCTHACELKFDLLKILKPDNDIKDEINVSWPFVKT